MNYYVKSLTLTSLLFGVALLYYPHRLSMSLSNNFANQQNGDTANRKDSFQVFINKYSGILYKYDSSKSKINDAAGQISFDSIDIANFKGEQIDNNNECLKYLRQHVGDSNSVKLNTLQKTIYDYCHKDDLLSKNINDKQNGIETKRHLLQQTSEFIKNNAQSYKSNKDKLNKAAMELSGSQTFVFKSIRYNAFIVDLDSLDVKLYWRSKNTKNYLTIGNLLNALESEGIKPLMITNAGMFTKDFSPKGLYVESNKKLVDLDTTHPNTDANFYLKPNGVFFIDTNEIPKIVTTEDFAKNIKEGKKQINLATQSGPMLVINDEIHKSFVAGSSNKKIRSGVGILSDRKIVFTISNNETSFFDFGCVFKDIFGCKNALFLDGAISEMYLSDINPKESGGNFGPMIAVIKPKK